MHLARFVGRHIYQVVSFGELGPPDLESCRSNPFLRKRNVTFIIPTVQRVLGSVVCIGSRLPHSVDVFRWDLGMCPVLFWDLQC